MNQITSALIIGIALGTITTIAVIWTMITIHKELRKKIKPIKPMQLDEYSEITVKYSTSSFRIEGPVSAFELYRRILISAMNEKDFKEDMGMDNVVVDDKGMVDFDVNLNIAIQLIKKIPILESSDSKA
jgi:ABC-type lipoprotein release transport system permease subunit